MKIAELKTKTIEELQTELVSLLKELFSLRIQRGAGQTPQTHLFKKVRRQIARIKTFIHQKKGT